MRATITRTNIPAVECVSVSTEKLQDYLGCGRSAATEIGKRAGAKIKIGKRVLWNMSKIQKYLDTISE